MRDVGIVMPVYKQDPDYLELALRSILQQSYKNYYFVIISDGAPLETVNTIKEVTSGDERVHLISKKVNEGVAKTLNIGFEHLMNIDEIQYLTWVSSDNIYYPNFLEKLRQPFLKGSDELGLVFSSFRHVDKDGSHIINKDLIAFRRFQQKPKESLLEDCFIGTSFMYKKKYASMIDGYSMEPVEDYEYWLRLTEICDIHYVPEELMDYRVSSPHSISAQLKSSTEQHRRWRYYYNLAKQQARNRRNIPFETTIIYPEKTVSEDRIKKYELFLEQLYSNYKLLLIDISPSGTVSDVIKKISDPRIAIFKLPNKSLEFAVQFGINRADTPFTMLFNPEHFPPSPDILLILRNLYDQISEKVNPNQIASTYFTKSPTEYMPGKPFSFEVYSPSLTPSFCYLYRTENLKQILKLNGARLNLK